MRLKQIVFIDNKFRNLAFVCLKYFQFITITEILPVSYSFTDKYESH